MSNDGDQPKPERLPAIETAANAVHLTSIDGGRSHKNKVVDVITGKIHDLPEHFLKPVEDDE